MKRIKQFTVKLGSRPCGIPTGNPVWSLQYKKVFTSRKKAVTFAEDQKVKPLAYIPELDLLWENGVCHKNPQLL